MRTKHHCHVLFFVCLCVLNNLMAGASSSGARVVVKEAGSMELNGQYREQDPLAISSGFAATCKQMGWNTNDMWDRLTDKKTPWYEKEDGAYIYFNRGDGKWWIEGNRWCHAAKVIQYGTTDCYDMTREGDIVRLYYAKCTWRSSQLCRTGHIAAEGRIQ